LKVNDLPVPERDDLVTLDALSTLIQPRGRADHPVLTNERELGLDLRRSTASFLDLERQDLTGLVGPASGRRPFPPEVARRNAAPLRVLGQQRSKRAGVALAQCLCRSSKFIDHYLPSMPPRARTASSAASSSAWTVRRTVVVMAAKLERVLRAARFAATDARIPKPLRWFAAFGLLPIPGPVDEIALLIVAVPLALFYRQPLVEAWHRAGRESGATRSKSRASG
jgi:hypothetical protein